MNTSLFMNVSSACAGGPCSEVVTTSAHRCCPCSGLVMWILQGLLLPPGTLGISSVGFVFFSGLYGHSKQLLCEMKAMPVPSLPQMGWFTNSTVCGNCHAGAAETSQCTLVHWDTVVRFQPISCLQDEFVSGVQSCGFIFEMWRNK